MWNQAVDQAGNGRLSAAGLAAEKNTFAFGNGQGYIFQGWFFCIFMLKADFFDLDHRTLPMIQTA